jgi:hypothetical protein
VIWPNGPCNPWRFSFDRGYRRLLTAMQQAFSGQPDKIQDAIDLMRDLKAAARNMLNTPDPNDPSLRLTPSWEYLADPTPH